MSGYSPSHPSWRETVVSARSLIPRLPNWIRTGFSQPLLPAVTVSQSPKEGQDFAEVYYGDCANEDSDGDGLNNCVDRLPDDFSGMYARIDDDGVGSGSCNAADSWSEMKNNFGRGSAAAHECWLGLRDQESQLSCQYL